MRKNSQSICFMEHIWLSKGKRAMIKEKYKVTDSTISDSLNFRRYSLLNRRIRLSAMNEYEGIYSKY